MHTPSSRSFALLQAYLYSNITSSLLRNKENPDQQGFFYHKLCSTCSSSLMLLNLESWRDFTVLPLTFTKYFHKFPTYWANNTSSPVNVPTEAAHQLGVSCTEHPAGSLDQRTAGTACGTEVSPRTKPASRATGLDKNWCSKDLRFWFIALLSRGNTELPAVSLCRTHLFKRGWIQGDSRLHFVAIKLKL